MTQGPIALKLLLARRSVFAKPLREERISSPVSKTITYVLGFSLTCFERILVLFYVRCKCREARLTLFDHLLPLSNPYERIGV